MDFESKGKVYRISSTHKVPINIKEAWEFFSNPTNLATITPDSLNFKILSGAEDSIFKGQIIQYKVKPFPFYATIWVTEITYMEKEKYFVDEQRYGPYSFWHHKHFFKSIPGGVEMTDIVDYKVPFGWIGRILSAPLIKKELKKIFTYRNQKLTTLFGNYNQ